MCHVSIPPGENSGSSETTEPTAKYKHMTRYRAVLHKAVPQLCDFAQTGGRNLGKPFTTLNQLVFARIKVLQRAR
jgi:hypothetical protein